MVLPIKIIDFVTLLFLSLLVVIIVFIILQRNIKRFKLRNVRDPHFLACKSIPLDLKEAILRKHSRSHAYTEPAVLLTANYQNMPDDKVKTFVIRIKAFEASKNLENALCDFGYRRPLAIKFEDFIQNLLNQNDETLPNELLKEFNKLYIWAMLDPMKFDNEQLRKLNKLINTIIEQLASSKKNEQINQHKLELNSSGDCDFNKKFKNQTLNQQQSQQSKTKRDVKFSNYNDIQPTSSFNIEKMNFNSNNNNYSSQENMNSKSSKLKNQASKLAKSVFGSRKNSMESFINNTSSKTTSNNSLTKEKVISSSKYEEIKDSSFDSQTSANRLKSPFANDFEQLDNDQTNRWSITNDSIKAFDSENEEIPLVNKKPASNHQKKRSNHSVATVTQISANASSNRESVNQPSSVYTITTPLASAIKNLGEENEGFSQTFETNF